MFNITFTIIISIIVVIISIVILVIQDLVTNAVRRLQFIFLKLTYSASPAA